MCCHSNVQRLDSKRTTSKHHEQRRASLTDAEDLSVDLRQADAQRQVILGKGVLHDLQQCNREEGVSIR